MEIYINNFVSGLYIAVSLDSSLPIVATRVDGLKISLELNVRGSSLVAFSPGGHLLAATQRNVISLISFRTLDVAFVLLGHKGSVSMPSDMSSLIPV